MIRKSVVSFLYMKHNLKCPLVASDNICAYVTTPFLYPYSMTDSLYKSFI